MKATKNIRRYIDDQKRLEDRLFSVVLMVGVVIVWISMVITFIEKLGPGANIGPIASAIMLLAVIFVAYKLKKMDLARLMLCYTLNCFVVPLAFFSCGGIDSGMPLYMLAGQFLVVPVLKGAKRIVCIIVTFLMDVACIAVSYYIRPFAEEGGGSFFASLTPEARIADMICSVVLIGLYIVITTSLIMDAYQKERESAEELLMKLDELSSKDELTGLYNRRGFLSFLEQTPVKDDERYYLCMIDIDHFKRLNDTYGHFFGNSVLRQLATLMTDETHEDNNEIVVRYGGEEFLIIIKADSKEEAYRRIDRIRANFVEVRWDKDPDLLTSFSAGIVRCSRFGSTSEAIDAADKLLYAAKESGRNLIKM